MIEPDKPVEDIDNFYGQEFVVKKLFSRIGAGRPQSVAVIGGRKSGKTSILNYIYHEEVRSRFLENPEHYIFIKIHISLSSFRNSEDFLRYFLSSLDDSENEDCNYYSVLPQHIQKIHDSGKRIIFLLDDFHLITSDENFPLEFFSFLRSLANNYNLAYVTTSYLELQKLCVVKDIEDSPFFNIFTNMTLGLLEKEDAVRLMNNFPDADEKTAEKIAGLSGYSPYIMKRLASEYLQNGSSSDEINEDDCLKVIDEYFTEIISFLQPEAYKALKLLSRDKAPDMRDMHHFRPLIKQGFLIEDEDEISCFSPLFKLFLKKNMKPKMLKGRDRFMEDMDTRI